MATVEQDTADRLPENLRAFVSPLVEQQHQTAVIHYERQQDGAESSSQSERSHTWRRCQQPQNSLTECDLAGEELTHKDGEQTIEDVRLSTESRLLVGFVNVEGEKINIKQHIRNITADSKAQGIIGVAKNVNIDQFFKS